MSNTDARQQALQAMSGFVPQPTAAVTYRSNGKVLVLGSKEEIKACDQLPDEVSWQAVSGQPSDLDISGFLGQFTVSIGGAGAAGVMMQGDAILDLHEHPVLDKQMLPPGYFHAPVAEWEALDIADQLSSIEGEFEKPKYFKYDPSICAHGANGKSICTRCIDACPAEAIVSAGDKIEVNPNLCQGGGSCAAVCPSGAITYAYPGLQDSGKRLRLMLEQYRNAGGTEPSLLFHQEDAEVESYLQSRPNLLPVPAEELASVGPDLMLSAFSYGAETVELLLDDSVPEKSRQAIESQIGWIRELMSALRMDGRRLALVREAQVAPDVDDEFPAAPMSIDLPVEKRRTMFLAVDHLFKQAAPEVAETALRSGAPFGTIAVDSDKCTLCFSCVSACPGKALQDGSGSELPELRFVESKCLQCGACEITCPESAINLTPRFIFDAEQRNRSVVVGRDKPFACISCGKAFAPESVISKMTDKLKDHHMFGTERAMNRLKMCEDCRVADVVNDPEAFGGQFDPMNKFRSH